jgi:hypothetical protein
MARLIKSQSVKQWIVRDEWCEDDIADQCEQIDVELSKGEIRRVLELIVETHDCEIGINWNSINSAIDAVLEARK